jgi:hypothetical protein
VLLSKEFKKQARGSGVPLRSAAIGKRSKGHSILPSLVQTARRQGVLFREFLQTLLPPSLSLVEKKTAITMMITVREATAILLGAIFISI